MEKQKYVCPKCGHEKFEKDQIQTTGGTISKLFDVQDKKFITISCEKCGYTELYKTESNELLNVLDYIV